MHLTLNHFSRDPDLVIKNRDKEHNFKPQGLWLADGDDWRDVCDIGIGCGEHKYEVVVDMTDILVIDTVDGLVEFGEKYINSAYRKVDWSLFFKSYKGIYVKNFHRIKYDILKLDPLALIKYSWFIALDVSSCCVNDTSCIVNYRKISDENGLI